MERKVRLIGLRRCSQPKSGLLNDQQDKQLTSCSPPCPIKGAFVNRDCNAAANIAQSLLFAHKNTNLSPGNRVDKENGEFMLQKPVCLSDRKKKMEEKRLTKQYSVSCQMDKDTAVRFLSDRI